MNPADLNTVEGVYPLRPRLEHGPVVGGSEGVGRVAEVGPDVHGLCVGDLVVPVRPNLGTWGQELVALENEVHKVREGPLEGLALTSVCMATAFRLLEDFVELCPGDVVIQNAATSAVGQVSGARARAYPQLFHRKMQRSDSANRL